MTTPTQPLSKDEVRTLAIKNHWHLLYQCICYYEVGQCNWEEAMQVAAIELTKQNHILQEELKKALTLRPAALVIPTDTFYQAVGKPRQ